MCKLNKKHHIDEETKLTNYNAIFKCVPLLRTNCDLMILDLLSIHCDFEPQLRNDI